MVPLISLPGDDTIDIIMHACTYLATHYKEVMWTTVESVLSFASFILTYLLYFFQTSAAKISR